MGLFSRKKKQLQLPGQDLPPIPKFRKALVDPHTLPQYAGAHPQEGPQFPEVNKEVKYSPKEPEKFPEITETKPMEFPRPAQETNLMHHDPIKEEHPDILKKQEHLNIPLREPSYMKPQRYPEREALAQKDNVFAEDPAARALQEQKRRTVHKEEHPLVRTVHKEVPPPARPPITQHGIPEGMQQSASADKPIFVKLGQYREAMSTIQTLKQQIQETEDLLQKFEELCTKEQTELENAKTNLYKVKEKLLSIDKHLFET